MMKTGKRKAPNIAAGSVKKVAQLHLKKEVPI